MRKTERQTHLAPAAAVLLVAAVAGAASADKPLWLAVTRPSLAGGLEPLAALRRGEGYETLISTKAVGEAISAAGRAPAAILLVGDDLPGQSGQPWYLPARRRNLYRWRDAQMPQFASDALWGDLDADLVPDVPVGRIPARTREQVDRVVGKIIAYQRRQPNPDDLRLLIWTGTPAYGSVLDSLATFMLLSLVRAKAPPWARPWIISSNPGHPLCGWPPEQAATFVKQMRKGAALTLFMGHGREEAFYSMAHDRRAIYFTVADAAKGLSAGPPSQPAVFITCYCGHFARSRPCLGESLLFLPGGPVATIGATTESHPLTNYFTGLTLLLALHGGEKRIGPLWLSAQRRAMKARNPIVERMLRGVEGALEDRINLDKLRRDQVLMYALLGDPATPLKLPDPLEVRVTARGSGWRWRVERPAGATALHVGLRAKWRVIPPRATTRPTADQARTALTAFNARFGFAAAPSPPADAPWEGTVDKPGRLRLVATGPGRLYAAAVELRPPTTVPAEPAGATPTTKD